MTVKNIFLSVTMISLVFVYALKRTMKSGLESVYEDDFSVER